MARVVHGLGDESFKLVRLDAMRTQPGVKTESREEVADEDDRLLIRVSRGVSLQFQSASDSHPAINPGFAGGAEFHASDQAKRVGESMMHSANRRERMRERMNHTQVFLKRHRAHRRGNEHVAARFEVIAVGVGAGQGLDDQADAFEGDAVAHRVKLRAGKALDAMRERIRASGGSKFRWQAGRELRIENHQLGEQLGVKEHGFAMRGIQRDHRTATDFAPGARRRRDGDARSESGPIGCVIELREIKARPFDQQPRRFARIQRAAATDGDDSIAVVLHKGSSGITNVLFHRVWVNSGIYEPFFPLCFTTQCRGEGLKSTGGNQSGIGDDQRASNTEAFRAHRQLGHRAGAEECGSGKRKRGEVHGWLLREITNGDF